MLRQEGRCGGNRKQVHRLWKEEGLQARMHSRRKRAGISRVPQVQARRTESVVGVGL
ncbi:transposase [Antrihabitans cavernicola]|uniref:Transposase n=1 Tax=Antrihabitans cavernicola TaxID=2495913 RepID=A0A5A7SHG4_9NOCA|nr:transposase [Spelaeibacter cavernicola]